MLSELSRLQKNILDGSWWSAIGMGWIAELDWLTIIGIIVGIVTLFIRHMETKSRNRQSDIRERELEWKMRSHNKPSQ